MKRLNNLILFSCVVPLAFVACSKKKNNPVSNVRTAVQDTNLQGKNFRGGCDVKMAEALISGLATGLQTSVKSAREQYKVVGNNITHTTKFYSTADCNGPEAMIFTETGTITLYPKRVTDDGGKFIDLRYDALQAQTTDSNGVMVARAKTMCGTNDWAEGTTHNVTKNAHEATCYGVQFPHNVENIYHIEGDTLYFGDEGTLNQGRPTKLDKNDKYIAN